MRGSNPLALPPTRGRGLDSLGTVVGAAGVDGGLSLPIQRRGLGGSGGGGGSGGLSPGNRVGGIDGGRVPRC